MANLLQMPPIDLVYTWVNDKDPAWQQKKQQYLELNQQVNDDQAGVGRFVDSDELRFSLRSVEKFASWVNHIFIVTDQQTPSWLKLSHPKVSVIDHTDIFPDSDVLPSFNSMAIEACLHRIPDLSEHFIYANDDVFFGSECLPTDFINEEGLARLFVTPTKSRKKLEVANTNYHKVLNKARALVEQQFGQLILNEPTHAFKAFNKSALIELENLFLTELSQTRGNRFRSEDDLYLAALYIFARQSAADPKITPIRLSSIMSRIKRMMNKSALSYVHINLNKSSGKVEKALNLIESMRPHFFCINDGENTPQQHRDLMKKYLNSWFPTKSEFER